ncbi:MAG: acetate--CoA ligase family protein [Acidobacteria bacterium]|nr:acetate--CoA ligase family protein [Acidobacteriota bacterium]
MTRADQLKAIWAPRSVAVIGASANPHSLGRAVFANLLFAGYNGCVYPVNMKARSVLGVRAYPRVTDIPDDIDLAVVLVPAGFVPQVLKDAGRKGVKGAIVISAGFKEVGGEGIELERQLEDIAQTYGMAIVGPNCFGAINTDPNVSLNATFSRNFPLAGKIAFISQSGAVGVGALEYAAAEKIGFSKFVSIGNKVDVYENDLLEILADDPMTEVILLYLEALENPKEFVNLALKISEKKPILAVKSGRTKEGAKAAASHTGALSGSDEAYDSLFAQCGVLRVETLEELFRYGIAFADQPLPRGPRVAIVTNAGGPGIMATDAAVRHNLELASLEQKTQAILRSDLPSAVSLKNPIDLIGDADESRYQLAMQAVLTDDNVDGVIAICVPQMATNLESVSTTIVKQARFSDKPVFAVYMATGDIQKSLQILEDAQIPHYRFPEDAVRAMGAMVRYDRWRKRPRTDVKHFDDVQPDKVRAIIDKARSEKRRFLPEPEAYGILAAYGLPISRTRLVHDDKAAIAAATEIGFPVAMKIVSPNIVHKVDVGGVKLNLCSESDVRHAYSELMGQIKAAMQDAEIWGVLIQEMVHGGKETILGMKRDPLFGGLLMFGLGGIYVEVFKDVTFRIAPIRELSAKSMIERIKGIKLLKGFRGEPPCDLDAIAQSLLRLSQLVTDFPEIEEMDINPLIVLPAGSGARVVDARILIGDSDGNNSPSRGSRPD